MSEQQQTTQVVEVVGLSKHFRGRGADGKPAQVTAVDAVSLAVHAGELVVLLGPSGCGKTTLLRCIAGLDQGASGEISINGRRVFSARDKLALPPEDRHIGMMFQSYALWPHMTVADNVGYPLATRKPRAEIQASVAAMLERLGVAGLGHRFPSELSGGQQQRVALARALIASPSVILFDEPLSNVDAKVRRRLRAELRELKARTRFAGVYVTHDQEEAMELADTLVVMESGRIRQSAPPREVYSRPASLYVAEFVGEINRWAARATGLEAGSAQVETELGTFGLPGTPDGAVPGASGWLGVRPEHVVIEPAGPAAAGDGHRFRGIVRDAIYLGARIECRIRLQNTDIIAWLSDEAAARAAPAPGQEVTVLLPSQRLLWLPA